MIDLTVIWKGAHRAPFSFKHTTAFHLGWLALLAALCVVLPLPVSLHAAGSCESSAIEVLEDRRLEPALLKILNGAEKEVWIGAFMFKVGDRSNNAPAKLFEALVRLHRSGVRVRVILERPEDARSDLAGFNSRTARLLIKEGIEVIMDRADRRSHMKIIVVDRRYTILGSHNLTQSALRYNHEYSVLVDSPCLAQKTVRYLQGILRESGAQ